MILNLLRRYHYFAYYTIDTLADDSPIKEENPNQGFLDKKVITFLTSYFWWRGRKVEYFEPHTTKGSMATSIIIGTVKNGKKIKRAALIFLLELYAQLENSQFQVSPDFERQEKKINGKTVYLYKIKV